MKTAINKMHSLYGTSEGICKECANFRPVKKYTVDGAYAKCSAYGIDNTVETDWLFAAGACGLKNKNLFELDIAPVMQNEMLANEGKQQKIF